MSTVPQSPSLVKSLFALLAAHRAAFGQERVYLRALGLVLGELFAFGHHRVTDLLRAMQCSQADWTGWYRLWQRPQRFLEAAGAILFQQTLAHVPTSEPYVIGVDCTQVARDSQRMEGSSWLKCPRNPPFKIGIHRAQRFLNGSWLTPLVQGYSRAIPLRFLPAFPDKAVRKQHPAAKEQVVGLAFVDWLRTQLDRAGRAEQTLLCLADGGYDKPDFWKGLPHDSVALVRTAKNRALTCLPGPYAGTGRRRIYGEPAPAPQTYLACRDGWQTADLTVRGRHRRVVYRVEGPFLRRGMAAVPLFLLVVRGQQWQRAGRSKRRQPCFLLVNALQRDGHWQLPLPILSLLSWAWQRWELEVVHREAKTGFGLGDKQCFHPCAAVSSVQWSAWVYALLMFVGYQHYGLPSPPSPSVAWNRHPRRWSLQTVLDQCRLELSTTAEFRPLSSRSTHDWPEMEAALRDLALICRWPAAA